MSLWNIYTYYIIPTFTIITHTPTLSQSFSDFSFSACFATFTNSFVKCNFSCCSGAFSSGSAQFSFCSACFYFYNLDISENFSYFSKEKSFES